MSKETITYSDFPTICRLCLVAENLNDIFQHEKALITCNLVTDIKIAEDDLLPKNFCNNCVVKLNDISNFIRMCRDNNDILVTIALQEEDKIENCGEVEEICIKIEEDSDNPDDYNKDDLKIKPEVFDLFGSQEGTNKIIRYSNALDEHDYDQKLVNKCNIKSGTKIFSCNYCRKNFSTIPKLDAHIKSHAGIKPFKCDTCRRRFTQPQALRLHKFTHVTDKPVKCPECDWSGITKVQLTKHIKKHNEDTTDSPSVSKSRTAKRFKCTICNKNLTRKNCLKKHMRIHTNIRPFKCNVCQKSFRQNSTLKKHMLTHGEKVSCKLCSMKFNKMSALEAHMNRHNRTQKIKDTPHVPCKCELCGKTFITQSSFMQHLAVHEGENGSNLCYICGKTFDSLISHMLIHTAEEVRPRPFKCDLCSTTFRHQFGLTRHLRVHEGAHLCQFCNATFRTKKYLSGHLVKEHPEGVLIDKNLQCDFCQKIFLSASRFKRHLVVAHKTENLDESKPELPKTPCPFCGKLKIASNMKVHIRTHTGERPYDCQFCDRKFSAQGTLVSHENIHKGIKPYECIHCKKTFRQYSGMHKHLRRAACLKL